MPWIFLLGLVTGARAMTAMAVVCWFAWKGRLPMHGWAFWAAYLVSVIAFTVLALGEYIGDTLPRTPNRTAAGPAAARLVFGALAGALAANAMHQPLAGGMVLGALGAAVGTWGGFYLRAWGSKLVGRDLPVALLESAAAVGIAVYAARQISEIIRVTTERFL